MRKIELEIEHRYQSRFVGKHRLRAEEGLKVLGSSRDAHIRLLGDQVGGIHATLECHSGPNHWVLSDMGSGSGTWIRKKPVTELIIKGPTIINIGNHHLRVVPRELNSELFSAGFMERRKRPRGPLATDWKLSTGAREFHQIVLKKNGLLVDTILLELNETFDFVFNGKKESFFPPKKDQGVLSHRFGEVEIQQTIVESHQLKSGSKDWIHQLNQSEGRGPILGALFAILLLAIILGFAPDRPESELIARKLDDNQYTRLVFDAKKIRERKKVSETLRKNIEGPQAQKPLDQKSGSSEPAAARSAGLKVVNSIKSAGLSALVGKISKRASKNSQLITADGVSPDASVAGKALGVVGSATVGESGKVGLAGAQGDRIGGVSTAGKGGGSSSYKGLGGLASGNVGNSSVGILEEETEVAGGLDREVIARVIQSKLGEIRYCYERQLSANPNLYGKVKVKFSIGAAGTVETQSIAQSSLESSMVEGCILRRISGWKFPQPEGGTKVLVSYPFLFKSNQ